MNMSALGTLWSPMWITDEPTQPPRLFCARLRMACIMCDVLGAPCTRFKPWPVSRRRYEMVSESRSCSASDQRWNMSNQGGRGVSTKSVKVRNFTTSVPCRISRQSARLCIT
jgi:hypothetical protein